MRTSVIVFPGSNCDRDACVAARSVCGGTVNRIWHRDSTVPESDLIILPGGFSYGDYLRSGAMAANSPIMRDVIRQAKRGVRVLAICNGFQIATETGMLPGALMRNVNLRFVCRDVHLRIENADTDFTRRYADGQVIRIPVAHHDGNYFADDDTLERLEGEGRIILRYTDAGGTPGGEANPNGSRNDIAGILNEGGNVLGMMPHPERYCDPRLGGTDGRAMFESLLEAVA